MNGIIIASHGTLDQEAKKSLDLLYLENKDLETIVLEAYLAPRVYKVLHKPSLEECINKAHELGVTHLHIYNSCVVDGKIYNDALALIEKHKALFEEVIVEKPLLSSATNFHSLASKLKEIYKIDNRLTYLVGHGTGIYADDLYHQLDAAFKELGCSNIHVILMHGHPNVDDAIKSMDESVQEVRVIPLMMTSGNHVKHDIKKHKSTSVESKFTEASIEVDMEDQALLDFKEIRNMIMKK